jgi:hypothetical protein
VIVEVVGGADERPEVRVVDTDDLGRLVLAFGEVTDAEADEALRAADLGRLEGADRGRLDAAALRTRARPAAAGAEWDRRWEELVATARGGAPEGFVDVPVQSAAGA